MADRITDLTIDYQNNPLGIAREDVKFGWRMESERIGAAQKEYRIRVYRESDQDLIWDSGKIRDGRSQAIPYSGRRLTAGQTYFWKAAVRNDREEILESDRAFFTIADDLSQADWIAAPDAGQRAPFFRGRIKLQPRKIHSARISMTALGIYKLLVNGKEAQGNVLFAPGWTDYRQYVNYQMYDITSFLRAGEENILGVILGGGWYQSGFMTDYSGLLTIPEAGKHPSESKDPEAGKHPTEGRKAEVGKDPSGRKIRGLIAKITVCYEDGSRDVFSTEENTWKYLEGSPFMEEDFYDGEIFDAIIDRQIGAWTLPGFEDESWKRPVKAAYAGKLRPSAKAMAAYLDAFDVLPVASYYYRDGEIRDASGKAEGKYYGRVIRHYLDTDRAMQLKAKDHLIVDMGQNMVGHTLLTLQGQTGTRVTLKFAEALNDGKKPGAASDAGSDGPDGSLYRAALRTAKCRDRYIMAGSGPETYTQTFTYRGFRYVEITADTDLTIINMKGKVISSVGKVTGSLHTSDDRVNRLIENTIWSGMGNYLSLPTDCPQRDERAGWSGDAGLFAKTAALHFDVSAFMENYIEIMNGYRQMYGVYGPTMPDSDFHGWKTSGWSDAGVIIPWTMYLQTGDRSFIDKNYQEMEAYMDADNGSAIQSGPFLTDTDQETGYSSTLFGDWLAYSGASLKCINLIYKIYTLSLMKQMAEITGRKAAEEKFAAQHAAFRRKFIEKYIDADHNLLSASADEAGVIDSVYSFYPVTDNAQTAILWALKLGLYEDEQTRADLVRNLLCNIRNEKGAVRRGQGEDTLSVGFLGVNVILPVLSENGCTRTAYDLLLQDQDPSWLYAVKNGATTTWERWNSYSVEKGFSTSAMNSFNHYAYGSCAEWMYQYMAGIKEDPACPGYRHFILQPMPDPLGRITAAEGSYSSGYGTIRCGWESSGGRLKRLYFTIPANTGAEVYIPLTQSAKQKEMVWEHEGVTFVGKTRHLGTWVMQYRVTAGNYEYKA